MKTLFALTLSAAAISAFNLRAELNNLNHAEDKAGWKLLFDGKSMEHFRGYKKEKPDAAWKVEDDAIKLVGGGGDLMTKEKYQFFELALEWNLPKGGNSGIIYRVAEINGPSYKTGPEVQIYSKMKAGGKTDAGSCYALYAPKVANLKPNGQWNSVRLIIKPGNQVEHHMNGELLCSYQLGSDDWKKRVAASKFKKWKEFATIDKGHICLQSHGSEVWFRNLKILELK
ncbi:MAG: DUF1080 domain-containing protein [Opitutales bacterium]